MKHVASLTVLWVLDFVLLFTLWPSGGEATEKIGPVLFMWLVPTLVLVAFTWRWFARKRS